MNTNESRCVGTRRGEQRVENNKGKGTLGRQARGGRNGEVKCYEGEEGT